MASKDIILSREATRLWFLSDVLVLGKPFPLPTVFSLGDVFLMLGACVLLQSIMLFRASQSASDRKPQSGAKPVHGLYEE